MTRNFCGNYVENCSRYPFIDSFRNSPKNFSRYSQEKSRNSSGKFPFQKDFTIEFLCEYLKEFLKEFITKFLKDFFNTVPKKFSKIFLIWIWRNFYKIVWNNFGWFRFINYIGNEIIFCIIRSGKMSYEHGGKYVFLTGVRRNWKTELDFTVNALLEKSSKSIILLPTIAIGVVKNIWTW